MFVIQSAHPVRVILELNSETVKELKAKKTVLPFSKKQMIISLDPFLPEGIFEYTKEIIEFLVEEGFTTFIANNIAHLSLLKGKKVNVIAGPYLYTFNRWAVSWLENQDIGAFVSPYENNRKNLEETFDRQFRQRVLIPVFAYPVLFRMRFKLPSSYDFTYFTDKEGKEFKVNSTDDGSFVMPEIPFSIVDKTEVLHSLGFTRFLMDLSKTRISKGDFRQLTTAFVKRQILPEASRFNWKEGFYSQEKIDDYKAAAAAYAAGTFKPDFKKRKSYRAGSKKKRR